jgi:hypothetical protein
MSDPLWMTTYTLEDEHHEPPQRHMAGDGGDYRAFWLDWSSAAGWW